MTKKLKASALLKHRIILQAAFCVEDLLRTTEKGAERKLWINVVAEHMESLFESPKLREAKRRYDARPKSAGRL